MILVYDYYGLQIYFKEESGLPIRVYASRQDRESSILIRFRQGLMDAVELIEGPLPLDIKDQETFRLLIEKNISEIVKYWLDVFLYDKSISAEIINYNIRENS